MHITAADAKALGITLPEEEGDVVPEIKQRSTRSIIAPYRSKLEMEYTAYLETLHLAGKIASWHYETIKLRLGQGVWYIPDVLVVPPGSGRLEMHEIKGAYVHEKGRVKFHSAVDRYPWFRWFWVTRQGGVWKAQEFFPGGRSC